MNHFQIRTAFVYSDFNISICVIINYLKMSRNISVKRKNIDRNNNDDDNVDERQSKREKRSIERYGDTTKKNLNHLFPTAEIVSDGHLNDDIQSSATREVNDTNSSTTSERDEAEIVSIISKMSENIKFLTDKVNSLSAEISHMRNSSVLKIGNDEVSDEEKHLLEMFDSFHLPIEDQNRLEELETYLENDQTFKIFFVSNKTEKLSYLD